MSLHQKLAKARAKKAFFVIPSAAVGAIGGVMDDEDRSESSWDKALRGGATGAITGLGADVGLIGGGLLGYNLAGKDAKPVDRLRGAVIGGGIGALSTGVLAYLLARRKKKYYQSAFHDTPASR